MSYIIQLLIFSLFIFIVRAFNESCIANKTSCITPFNCTGGYCLCSPWGKVTDEKNPILFWTGDQCIKCPLDYTSSATKCYQLITGKDNQMNWIRARKRCQENGGDLLVIRSEKEYRLLISVLRNNVKDDELFQRTPSNGTSFASVWIGAQLTDWNGAGTVELVSHGPTITKDTYYWCSRESPLGQEPNHLVLKETGERQQCLALAFFQNKFVCMHDWFCSWDSYFLCEFHPPPPNITTNSGIQALEDSEKPNNMWLYMGILGIGVFLLLILIGTCYYMCRKKNNVNRTRSTDSADSASSEN